MKAETVQQQYFSPRVAVVILNYNGAEFLSRFLPSVLQSTYTSLEIIVADNASTDDSLNILATQFPQVSVLAMEKNTGYAGGYQEALKQIDADYYVLLNSDVEVTPQWIEPIIAYMEANLTVAACQPKILSYSHRKKFEYAGAAGGWMDEYGYPFARGRVFDTCEDDNGQYDDIAHCFWASGCALFVKAHIFHKLGGLDDYFFAHMEEIDFCWRAQNAGYQIACVPQSVVYHVGGGTLPQGNARKTYLNFRNNLIMLYKNLPVANRNTLIFKRMMLDGIAAVKSVITGFGDLNAIWKAHNDFRAWKKIHGEKYALKSPQPLTGLYKGNIVWNYFVKGKKKFSQIVDNQK